MDCRQRQHSEKTIVCRFLGQTFQQGDPLLHPYFTSGPFIQDQMTVVWISLLSFKSEHQSPSAYIKEVRLDCSLVSGAAGGGESGCRRLVVCSRTTKRARRNFLNSRSSLEYPPFACSLDSYTVSTAFKRWILSTSSGVQELYFKDQNANRVHVFVRSYIPSAKGKMTWPFENCCPVISESGILSL